MRVDRRTSLDSGFADDVYRLASQIPSGKVSTYGAIAFALRKIHLARAVGMALHMNPDLSRIPCHRVVKYDGSVGGYSKGTQAKTRLLRREGIIIRDGRVLNFETKLYVDFI